MEKTNTARLRRLLEPALSISIKFKEVSEQNLFKEEQAKAKEEKIFPLIEAANRNKDEIFELSEKLSQKLIKFLEQVYELIEIIKTDPHIQFESIQYLLNVQDMELKKEIDWLLEQAERREQLEMLLEPSRILPHLLVSEVRDEALIAKNIKKAIKNEPKINELINQMNAS